MGKRKKYYKSRVPLGGSVSKNSSYKTPLARRLQRGEEPNSSGAQSTVLDQSSSAEGGASVGSAEFDSLNNAVIARFCQDRGVIAVDLSNAIVPLAITYSEHLSLPSVGYGALVPKAKDVLKVKLVDKAEKGEYCKAATDRYAIESVRLSQLSPRSSEEWLTFVEATRRHLESSGSNASIYDIGNLEIVWGQLLTADFSYVLSSAIGRFLLALRSRCRELRQYSLDSAFDWLLDQLMLSDCLSRLMKPLLLRAINLKQVKVAAVANEENENADQQILGPLTRLICSKDETVLNCKLLPMARELAPSQSDNDLLSLLHCRRLLQPASSCSTTRKPIDAVSNCESLSTEDYCEIVDAVELEDTYFEIPETRTEPFEEDERVKIIWTSNKSPLLPYLCHLYAFRYRNVWGRLFNIGHYQNATSASQNHRQFRKTKVKVHMAQKGGNPCRCRITENVLVRDCRHHRSFPSCSHTGEQRMIV
uniref:BTB domain-containing protein n=1 Tax=Macrostomum lignano TaxID=282301 RepID=A0A1I8H4Y0_9PLAT